MVLKKLGRSSLPFLYVVAGVLALDQFLKFLFNFVFPEKIFFVPGNFLNFTLIHNFGAGFGILQGQRWLLILVGIVALVLINYVNMKTEGQYWVSLALIFAGALGNLIDRAVHGYVIDFVNFSFFPAFNVADAAISVGAILLVYFVFRDDLEKALSKIKK